MSVALASLAVTAGKSYTYNVGSTSTVGAVVVLNESPYGLNVSGGASSQWIAAQTADLVPCNSMGFNGNLTITTDSYLDNASSAPSFLVYFTAFAPGEAIRGTYPSPLARLISGSSLVATQVINDGNLAGTHVIESTPQGASQSYIVMNNDGTLNMYYKSAALGVVQSFIAGPTPDVQYGVGFQVSNGLFVFGTTELDAGGLQPISTDGNGNIKFIGNINSVGVVTATAPIKLASGYQETGFCGDEYTGSAATQHYGVAVNFKTTLTNTPTSITLTPVSTSNVTLGGASILRTTGFALALTTVAAGDSFWFGTYTTAGNCLLAVDATAGTVDHHCDGCGHVSRGVPLASVQQMPAQGGLGLSYTCSACGASEQFNTEMTSADEVDTTPQGSGQYTTTRGAQATLIRQLMTALGMEVAP